jgi:gliding motility-associated-like protein
MLLLCLLVPAHNAQAQCTNADFENGSFGGWTGSYGISYMNGGCLYSNPGQFSGFLQGPLNNPSNDRTNHYCHVLTSAAGGNDAFLATNGINVPVNWPGAGSYSARIGNTWPSLSTSGRNKPDAESMIYTFPVTAADAAFTYHYAVILNVGPGHIPTEQPYFHIRMVTSAGDTINCASFDVDASSARNVGGFDSLNDNGGAGQIYYKRWTSVYIPLYNYIGQTVSVIFTTSSCNPNQCAGKHFAIAYLDAECGPISLQVAPTVTCSRQSYTITAPAGAATYAWTGPGITTAANGPVINVNQTGRYTVTMRTFGTNPCTFTLDTMITVSAGSIFTAAFTASPTCLGSPTQFTDFSYPAGQITFHTWETNGTSFNGTNPSYTFPGPGTYPVRLTVGSPPCVDDTTISVVVVAPPTSSFTVTGPICAGQTSTVIYTGTAPATGTYTWNFAGGTIVSGSGAGPYQIRWATSGTKSITLTVTSGGCTSPVTTRTVTVTPFPTITLPSSTYSCQGANATLTPVVSPAGGTYLWSTAQTTPSISVSPSATTHYTVVYTLGTCSVTTGDSVIITKPGAGADKIVACAALPGGTATMSGTGTGTWTAATGNPGTATITTPGSPTTTITGFTAAGTYKFVLTNTYGCTDTASVVVTAKPNAGADKNVNCAILPGGAVTMGGSGSGTWSAATGNPGTATIITPPSSLTRITGFTAAGTYRFIWTNASGCSDTAAVVVTAKPNAGADMAVSCAALPGGTAAMAATGTGTWTAMTGNPGTANIANASNATTSITGFTTAGTYKFIWTNASGCSDTASVAITAKPTAGADKTVNCAILPGGTAAMTATGAGTWTAMTGNPGTATIAAPASPTTNITGFTAAGTYRYIWTNASGCTDTVAISVTAKPNAGADKTVSCAILPGGSAAMSATGTGTWTALTGNPGTAIITAPTAATTAITTFTAAGTYGFIWTNASGCSDTASVIVTAKPNAGSDQTVNCIVLPGGTATMTATGTGTWTARLNNPGGATIIAPTSATTTITGFTAAGTYRFIWTNTSGCADTADIIVTAKPNAGQDKVVSCTALPGGTAAMAAAGTGTWSAMTGNPGSATITTPASAGSTITGFTAAGTYRFVWTNASGCADTASVTVTAKPNAGNDQTISCAILPGGAATMTATGTGTWTAMAGNAGTAVITAAANPATNITGFTAAGTYRFIWSNVSGCSDTASVVVTAKPNAGSDKTVSCAILPGGSVSMSATGTGTWTAMTGNPGSASITNTAIATTSITGFTAAGTYRFIWSNASGCDDTASVIVTAKPDAGADMIVSCAVLPGGNATMSATGTGTWTAMTSNPGTANIANANNATTSITGFTTVGTYKFIWTNASGCSDTASVSVTGKPNAGSDQSISCVALPGGTAAMTATGTGTWTAMAGNPGSANITNVTGATTRITGFTAAGTYRFVWTNASGCSDTSTVSVTGKPSAGPDQTVACVLLPGGNATMAATGTGTWTAATGNPGTAAITNTSSPTTTISNFTAAGTYYYIWTNASGCSDTASVTVTRMPTVTLPGAAYCQGGSATLAANASPAGGTYLWSNNATTPSITVNATTTTNFTVRYTLGTCFAAATDTVTVYARPQAVVTTTPATCTAHNGVARVHASGTSGYSYSWSNPGGTGDSISHLAAGTYQVTVTDIHSCTTTASGTVVLQSPNITIREVSQHNLKCFNDGTGEIHINATDTAGGVATHTYTYSWSNTATTKDIVRVPAGSYTVSVSDQFGCTATASYTVTQPAPLTATTTHTDPRCSGSTDGTAAVINPAGGSGNQHYTWSTNPAQSTRLVINLRAGTYTVTMHDDSLCSITRTVTLTDPTPIAFGTSTVTAPRCHGDSNGTALIVAQNGTGPYTYAWSYRGITGNPATGLPAGIYTVTATDANGCSRTTQVALTQPAAVAARVTANSATCFGLNDGSLSGSSSGGTPPFRYLWSTNDSSDHVTHLGAGTYTFTATDSRGCAASTSGTLTQPARITETITTVRPNCHDSKDGSIRAVANGGSGSFTYTLMDMASNVIQANQSTGAFTALGYGSYQVLVTDHGHCPVTDTIEVVRPSFNIYVASAEPVSCYGPDYTDGAIHVQGSNSQNGPFQYSINGGPYQTSPDFTGLPAGSYTVSAHDHYGCDTTFTIVVGQPQPATLRVAPDDTTVAVGASVQLISDFGPYPADSIHSYQWSPAAGLSCIDCAAPSASPNSTQSTYTLAVTYNHGCVVTATAQIHVPGHPPLFIPNAFSPNSDGNNDVWSINGAGIKDVKALLFDRWGEKVFESNEQSQGWDGYYKGELQEPGVFVFVVDVVYLNGETVTQKGSLTLIR